MPLSPRTIRRYERPVTVLQIENDIRQTNEIVSNYTHSQPRIDTLSNTNELQQTTTTSDIEIVSLTSDDSSASAHSAAPPRQRSLSLTKGHRIQSILHLQLRQFVQSIPRIWGIYLHESEYELLYNTSYCLPIIIWFFILGTGVALSRILCGFNPAIPYDCPTLMPVQHVGVVSEMCMKGGCLFVIARISNTRYLFSWYIYPIFYFTIFLFGYMGSQYPDLYIASGHIPSDRSLALIYCVSIVVAVLFYVHLALAWRVNLRYFLAYTSAILLAIGYFTASYYYLGTSARIRIHHEYLFWCLSLLCRYNHPLSKMSLAICSAIFIQGLAVYGGESEVFVDVVQTSS